MAEKRRLPDGRLVSVHRNSGVRKVCGCARRVWAKCPHPWHFSFSWKGKAYRLSLDRHEGERITSKTDADARADELRSEIRARRFELGCTAVDRSEPVAPYESTPTLDDQPNPVEPSEPGLTFAAFAEEWKKRRGYQLVRPRENDYRIRTTSMFLLPGTDPPTTFGAKQVSDITTGDIEAFRYSRRCQGLSAVTTNHDLRLLRKMFAWGVRERLLVATPFKIGTEAAIRLDPETARDRRLQPEDEERLLSAADAHLRAIIIAMLDTCCRPGEILSLQWRDVDLELRELTILPEKAKTRRARCLPISTRLLAILQMRRLDPAGEEHPPEAYVFGDAIGRRVRSIRTAWENTRKAAGVPGLHLADLRHEAGSRFEEAGVPTAYVSKFLGHGNLTTTTRYLNPTRLGLRLAVDKLEQHRAVQERRTTQQMQGGAPPLAKRLQAAHPAGATTCAAQSSQPAAKSSSR